MGGILRRLRPGCHYPGPPSSDNKESACRHGLHEMLPVGFKLAEPRRPPDTCLATAVVQLLVEGPTLQSGLAASIRLRMAQLMLMMLAFRAFPPSPTLFRLRMAQLMLMMLAFRAFPPSRTLFRLRMAQLMLMMLAFRAFPPCAN